MKKTRVRANQCTAAGAASVVRAGADADAGAVVVDIDGDLLDLVDHYSLRL